MGEHEAHTAGTTLSDRGASYLRTIIPTLWGSLVGQLLIAVSPHLPGDVVGTLREWLSGPTAVAFVSAVGIALWYVVARKLEPMLPDWLTRIVLGSAAAPTYAKTTADGQAVIVTSLPVTTGTGAPVVEAQLPVLTDDED